MFVVFICDCAFPHGDAGASRIVSYTKELVKAGVRIQVICYYPTQVFDPHKTNYLSKGVCDGVDYYYTAGTVYRPRKKTAIFKKIWLNIKSFYNCFKFLWRYKSQIDVIQTYTAEMHLLKIASFFSRIFKKPLVAERSELPITHRNSDYYNKTLFRRIYKQRTEKSYRLPDAWLLETQNLADYYVPMAKKEVPLCIVPMTVDIHRFTNVERDGSKFGKYIAYCGNMLEYDGISILIQAFAKIAVNHPDVKLVLAGSSADVPAQKELVERLGIQERVLFLGKIKGDEVPSFLSNAEILALASPKSMRASATMPCKIGEYLCTSRPVVVTGQGEILKYLTDGVNAYLAEPDSIDDFAAKLELVLSSPDEAKIVGENGQKVSLKEFNGELQAEKIIKFYSSVIERGCGKTN